MIALLSSGAGIVAAFVWLKTGVDPLLLVSRATDHARAGLKCGKLCWTAASQEWSRMYGACLFKARTER